MSPVTDLIVGCLDRRRYPRHNHRDGRRMRRGPRWHASDPVSYRQANRIDMPFVGGRSGPGAAAAADGVDDDEQDDGADNGGHPGAEIEEAVQ